LSVLFREQIDNPEKIAHTFYTHLRAELVNGNPYLDKEEQARLQSHYPFAMDPDGYPPELVANIYATRRAYPAQAILKTENPLVFDAGCGYGSDSLLFASMGAKVVAVDVSVEEVEIARKRKPYYEELLRRPFDVTFRVADLDEYTPEKENLSLTWLSSVLAIVRNQDTVLDRIYKATRAGGKVIIVDFNLLNPLFLWTEWRRRRRALRESRDFAREGGFWAMVQRRGRIGARFYARKGEGVFDDVQFFTPATLARLLQSAGFQPLTPGFSGFTPPFLFRGVSKHLERVFSRVPGLNNLGRAYVVTGEK
jgi:SAM-dependent methyltransferase